LHNDSRELTEKAVEYMNYMEPLTIPGLASQYGINSKQFAYYFYKYKGLSPNEFLIDYRMRRTKDLLCTTACSIAEISACVGYSDHFYFSKLFKKKTGLSPRSFRRNEKLISH